MRLVRAGDIGSGGAQLDLLASRRTAGIHGWLIDGQGVHNEIGFWIDSATFFLLLCETPERV